MTLLSPLGLLGLLSIIVLVLIYILRPNFQQKIVSSTYVWKLSIKYLKKRIPTSKLRNIILILCQILILSSAALILARPNQNIKALIEVPEVIAIIDASASMRTETVGGETRFERAVDKVWELAERTFRENGYVSVIKADATPVYLATRTTQENSASFFARLQELVAGQTECSYGTGNVNGAIMLCEKVLLDNPYAQITLISDMNYAYTPKEVNVISVADEDDWNAAILNAYAEVDEGYYAFTVEVASYGRASEIDLMLSINGANIVGSEEVGRSINLREFISCEDRIPKRVRFKHWSGDNGDIKPSDTDTEIYVQISGDDKVFSYESIHVSIGGYDSFSQDNNFEIYGGTKEALKVQYASSGSNPFVFNNVLTLKRDLLRANSWDLQLRELRSDQTPDLIGYDYYIFEHRMPATLPTDGVVILINPTTSMPTGSGLRTIGVQSIGGHGVNLANEEPHPLTNYIDASKLTVSSYTRLQINDDSYKTLISCANSPVLLVKDQGNSKIVVLSFSVHNSNLPIRPEFSILLFNIFEYFSPMTVAKNSFEVNESISLSSRGTDLVVNLGEDNWRFDTFPVKFVPTIPGTYKLDQTTAFQKAVTERIYVRVPASESNIWKRDESLVDPYKADDDSAFFKDLLIYVAAALVSLLFIEWWLQSRDGM